MQRSVLAVAVALAISAHCAAQDQIAALDEVVVTASRFKDRFDDKPVNMTVITSEDIRRSAAKTVPDLLSEQAGIQIRLRDQGPGIPTEDLHHVFDPFYSTTGRRGLGLTLAAATIRAHGGRLTLTSVPGARADSHG